MIELIVRLILITCLPEGQTSGFEVSNKRDDRNYYLIKLDNLSDRKGRLQSSRFLITGEA